MWAKESPRSVREQGRYGGPYRNRVPFRVVYHSKQAVSYSLLVRNGERYGSEIVAVPCRFIGEQQGERPFLCVSFSSPFSTERRGQYGTAFRHDFKCQDKTLIIGGSWQSA